MTYFGVPTNAMSDFERLRREMDSLFHSGLSKMSIRAGEVGAFPPVSVGETNEDVRVYAFAPGIDVKNIDLTLQGNLLRIATQRNKVVSTDGEQAKNVTWHRNERTAGEFSRLITLPETVDPHQVNANYKDGVLVIIIGKRPEVKPRKIEIKAV
jgi:HSP20 family protein